MLNNNRDDFDNKTKDSLAKRASYICSNPGCRRYTMSPSKADNRKYIYIGIAAHITSAAINGPRYNAKLTSEQRRDIENGIFLCASCSVMIDKNNGLDFPVETLKEWKSSHDDYVQKISNKSANLSPAIINSSKPFIDICHRGILVTEVEKDKLYFEIPYCSGKNANAYNVNLETGIILSTNDGFVILDRFEKNFPDNITLSYETGKSISFSLRPLSYHSLPDIYIGVRGTFTDESYTSTYDVFDVFKFNRIKFDWIRTLGKEDGMIRGFFETMIEQ